MAKELNTSTEVLPKDYAEALIASGLVHGIGDWSLLKPLHREFQEGEVLCEPNDSADCLWVVVKGTLIVRLGDETLVVRPQGSVVGEQALLDDLGHRRAQVLASLGTAEVLEIRKSAIEAHPQAARIWRNCAWILCKKLDESMAQWADINTQRREARRLLKLYVGEHALSEGKLAPSSVIHGPRSELTVIWFSDVVGFSKYSAAMLPHQAASFVQQFLTPQVEHIDRRRGFVDKFMGDGVMAYWVVTSRDGQSECETALEAAEESLRTLQNIKLGSDSVSIRVGLHIGRVSVGNFGTVMRSQFTLIGREVNKASRLESASEKDVITGGSLGPIRVSDEFYKVLRPTVQLRLPVEATISAKNIGEVNVHTTVNQDS